MNTNHIMRDALVGGAMFVVSLLVGVVLNGLRAHPLPIVYANPEARLDQSVKHLGAAGLKAPSTNVVSLTEMRSISTDHSAIILDARPEIFYRLGHIPSAINLPRDDFEERYRILAARMQPYRDRNLVVYCSGYGCEDSQMVGDALERLGYPHVRIFRGGWSEWDNGNLPEEKE